MATEHRVWASSFADPIDVRRFKHCKENGGTDDDCFEVGDNAKGVWNDDTSEGSGPSCALPPEVMEYYFGATEANKWREARMLTILVRLDGSEHYHEVKIKDRMPHIATLERKGRKYRIDLNPDTCRALGKEPHNFEERVYWRKLGDDDSALNE